MVKKKMLTLFLNTFLEKLFEERHVCFFAAVDLFFCFLFLSLILLCRNGFEEDGCYILT